MPLRRPMLVCCGAYPKRDTHGRSGRRGSGGSSGGGDGDGNTPLVPKSKTPEGCRPRQRRGGGNTPRPSSGVTGYPCHTGEMGGGCMCSERLCSGSTGITGRRGREPQMGHHPFNFNGKITCKPTCRTTSGTDTNYPAGREREYRLLTGREMVGLGRGTQFEPHGTGVPARRGRR